MFQNPKVVTNWLANFCVGLLFAPLQLAIGPYVFVIFIVVQILFIIYIKGRSDSNTDAIQQSYKVCLS